MAHLRGAHVDMARPTETPLPLSASRAKHSLSRGNVGYSTIPTIPRRSCRTAARCFLRRSAGGQGGDECHCVTHARPILRLDSLRGDCSGSALRPDEVKARVEGRSCPLSRQIVSSIRSLSRKLKARGHFEQQSLHSQILDNGTIRTWRGK